MLHLKTTNYELRTTNYQLAPATYLPALRCW